MGGESNIDRFSFGGEGEEDSERECMGGRRKRTGEGERGWARRRGGGKRGEDRGVKFCKDIGRF